MTLKQPHHKVNLSVIPEYHLRLKISWLMAVKHSNHPNLSLSKEVVPRILHLKCGGSLVNALRKQIVHYLLDRRLTFPSVFFRRCGPPSTLECADNGTTTVPFRIPGGPPVADSDLEHNRNASTSTTLRKNQIMNRNASPPLGTRSRN